MIIENIANIIRASLFYFELDSEPEYVNNKYAENNSIICSITGSDLAYYSLLAYIQNAKFFLNGNVILDSTVDYPDLFRKRVLFMMENVFTIKIQKRDKAAYYISGSSFSIKKLKLAQQMSSHFN